MPPFGFPTKDYLGFESSESKEPSLSSSSGAGSEQMSRKDYLDFDFNLKGASISSSRQGSKSSLVSSQHSETASPQNNVENDVSPTEQRTIVVETQRQEMPNLTQTLPSEEKVDRKELKSKSENKEPSETAKNVSFSCKLYLILKGSLGNAVPVSGTS